MSRKHTLVLVCSGLLAMSRLAFAVDADAPVIRYHGISAYPGVKLAVKSDSNIAQLPDGDPGKVSSNIAILSPALVLEGEQAANKYSFTYRADLARYSSSSADNYADHQLLGLAELSFSSSSSLKVQPEYVIGHDDRGSTFASTLLPEPNKWRASVLLGSYSYGADEARGRIVLDLSRTDLKYQNNHVVTDEYNRTLTSAGATFYFRVLPKTSLLVNAKRSGISYDLSSSPLNGNEQQVRAGVKWEATALTSGEIQVGRLQKRFDSTLSPTSSGSWQADVQWSPVPYINVDLVSSREANETTLANSSAMILSNTGANLTYELNDRVTLAANGYQLKQDFVGAARSDTTNTFGLKAEYRIRRWLIGGAELSNSAKTSNEVGNDYKRNIFTLSVKTAL